MAITETLEIRFQASTIELDTALDALIGRLNALGTLSETAGKRMTTQFAQAIADGSATIKAKTSTAIAAANFHSDKAIASAYSAGCELSEGLARGITARRGAVLEAAASVANAAAARIRAALQIHSPSKITFALGEYFSEGFANGILASSNRAEESAREMAMRTTNSMNYSMPQASSMGDSAGLAESIASAVRDAVGNVSITVPLTIDTMKLGEASIRGINLVTKSAGKLLLNI